jgi:lysophospholipase L1-like esterase
LSESLSGLRIRATLALVAAPVCLLQGYRLRRNTPRLPEAPAPREGSLQGQGHPLSLLAIGESPLAGVGVNSASDTVTAQLAGKLAECSGRPVHWRIVARGGVTVADTIAELLPQVPDQPVDFVLVGLGVNDCLRLTTASRWRNGLVQLIAGLTDRCRAGTVVLAGVPPMQHFPALPRPLSSMLGLRARLLDATAAELATRFEQVIHVPMAFDGRSTELFCRDGFHPGPHGHRQWSEQLAPIIEQRLQSS